MKTPAPGRRKVRVVLYFTPKALLELDALGERLNIPRTSVVAQAVAWFVKTQPTRQYRKRKNDADHAGV